MSRILLIDGNNVAYGIYSAFEHSSGGLLQTSTGTYTTIIYGFFRNFEQFLKKYKVNDAVICWDTGGGSKYRKNIFPYYKAGRSYKDMQLYFEELKNARNYFDSFGIKQANMKGIECDDIIGWLAKKYSKAGREVIIFSNDKDFYSLVNDDISVYRPIKDILYNYECVEEELGLSPEYSVRLKAFVGESSDNIPGACELDENGVMIKFGFGEAKAKKLDLSKPLRKIIKELETQDKKPFGDKFVEQLIKNKKSIYMSYLLARIRCLNKHYDKKELSDLKSIWKKLRNRKPVRLKSIKNIESMLEFKSLNVPKIVRMFGVEII